MQESLLQRSRSINKILQKIRGNPVDFHGIADVIAKNMDCTVFIIGRRGQVSGYSFHKDSQCTEFELLLSHTERFPESFNQELLYMDETRSNIVLDDGRRCIFNPDNVNCNCSDKIWSITPVFGGARRIGTLVLLRDKKFTEEDIILAEYGAIVVANEIMRIRSERIEGEARKKAAVEIAVATLSYSEREAIERIMTELNGKEGLLVASRIADNYGITRSVIVSALRKFESARVIESRSLGVKGTYIKVLNDYIFEELNK